MTHNEQVLLLVGGLVFRPPTTAADKSCFAEAKSKVESCMSCRN